MTASCPRSFWTVLLTITTVQVKSHPCSVCHCRLSPERVFCDDLGLTEIPEDIPPNTRVLRVHGNNISTVESGQFVTFSAMSDLDLSENLIHNVKDKAFSGLDGLRTLNLRGNRIVFVTWNTFTGLANLRELRLGRNPIMCLGTNTFAYLHLLESLDLGELLQLNAISKGAFSRLSRLLYLNVSASNLTGVPFLGYLHSLEELDVSHNGIKAIRVKDFESVSTLRKLLLSNNGLSVIEKYAFDALKFVYKLDLSDNSLRGLHRGTFKRMESLTKVNLKRNPWKCTCKLTWLAKWLREHIRNESPRVCGACKYPKHLRGKYLCNVSLETLTCDQTPTRDASVSSNDTIVPDDRTRCAQGNVPNSTMISSNGTTVVKGSFRVRVALSSHSGQGSDSNGSNSVPIVYRCPTEDTTETEDLTKISGIILPVTPTRIPLDTNSLPEDFDLKMCAKTFGFNIGATKGSPIQRDETIPDAYDHVDATKSYSEPTVSNDDSQEEERRTSRNTEYIVGATVGFIVLGILIWGSFFLHIQCKKKKKDRGSKTKCFRTVSCCCHFQGRSGKSDEENQVEIPDVNVPEVHSEQTYDVRKSADKPDLYTLTNGKMGSANLYVISRAQDVTYL